MTRPPTDAVWPYNTLSIFHSDKGVVCSMSVYGDVRGSTPLHGFVLLVGKRTEIPVHTWTGPGGFQEVEGPATQNAVCRSGLRSLSAAECYILSRLF